MCLGNHKLMPTIFIYNSAKCFKISTVEFMKFIEASECINYVLINKSLTIFQYINE